MKGHEMRHQQKEGPKRWECTAPGGTKEKHREVPGPLEAMPRQVDRAKYVHLIGDTFKSPGGAPSN